MRIVGPNSMGLVNTDPDVLLNASVSPGVPPRGGVAMSSQSGALGLAMLALARQRHLGVSTFISVGNKADISGNDLLQYWQGDEATRVILLYLESFGNPRRFARIARGVSLSKPIVVVKPGRAADDAPSDALFRQTGVIRADTLDEMFDLAAALDRQPLPAGRRVAILSDGGGPGLLCAGACRGGAAVGASALRCDQEAPVGLSSALRRRSAIPWSSCSRRRRTRTPGRSRRFSPPTRWMRCSRSTPPSVQTGRPPCSRRSGRGVAGGRAAGGRGKPVLGMPGGQGRRQHAHDPRRTRACRRMRSRNPPRGCSER